MESLDGTRLKFVAAGPERVWRFEGRSGDIVIIAEGQTPRIEINGSPLPSDVIPPPWNELVGLASGDAQTVGASGVVHRVILESGGYEVSFETPLARVQMVVDEDDFVIERRIDPFHGEPEKIVLSSISRSKARQGDHPQE